LWLVKFLKTFREVGIIMKNAILVGASGNIVSKFIGSNASEEKFFQQLGASIFLPTINALNPQSIRSDDKKILLQAQAEEMLEIMGSVFPPEIFPAMSHTFSRLTRLEGFGDQAFLYHRFLGKNTQIDAALLFALYPPSLECLAFNRWFSNYSSRDYKPIWLINKKITPEWFLKAPFGRVPDSEKAGMLKFLYGLLPADIAYRVQVDSLTRETLVSDFYWNGQNWFLATKPGKDLIDYQLSALIPLSEHHRRFALFKSELRSVMLLIFVFCGVVGWRLASGFVKPVRCFAETSERLMEGDFTARMRVSWSDEEFSQIAEKFNTIADDIENGRLLRKFVSDGALQTIVESEKLDLKKSLQTRRAVIMFMKYDGFGALTTNRSPAKALAELNRFFSCVCSSVKKAGGEVSKFIAEKAMTTFFVSDTDSPGERAASALDSAIAVIERLQRHKQIDDFCRVKVGIAFGHVRAGIIGVEAVRLEQTVIGDSVNLAARLCSHSGDYGVLVSGVTFEILKESGMSSKQMGAFRRLPSQEIKGKRQAVEVYSVDIAGYKN
jgi:adenylate cyclase